MKKTTNTLFLTFTILPLVLLFWPFAQWNDACRLSSALFRPFRRRYKEQTASQNERLFSVIS